MEKGEKSSPSPSRGLNFFDTANLLGPSPFGSGAGIAPPFAHLAHIPSAFSMLGRLPPFPMPPPFGGLGALADPLRASSALAHSSCASTGGAEWWRAASEHARRVAGNSTPISCGPAGLDLFTGNLSNTYSPLFTTLAQGHAELGPPAFDMFLQPALTDKSSFLHNAFSTTSPLSIMSPLKLSSSLPSPSSSTSSKATSSKASTSSAVNSGRNTSHSRKSPQKESSGKPRNKHRSSNSSSSVPASISSQSDYHRKMALASNPFLASSLLLGSELSSHLGEKPSESESVSDISSASSLSSDESSASSHEDKQQQNNKKRKRHSHKHSPKSNSTGPVIQIDGAKKQLMADQIRQKMQGKLTMPPPPLLGSMDNHKSKDKGGNSKHPAFGEDGLHVEDHKRSREDLKRTLEARLKHQQQLELKLLKQVHGEREDSIKHQHSPLNLHKSAGKGRPPGSKISQLLPFPGDLESHKSKLSLFHEGGSESNDHSELSSDSDPELENDEGVSGFGESSGESEDSDQEKSTMSEGSVSPSKGDKRAADTPLDGSLDGGSGHKRRRVLDEKELRIPLEHGWRRETRIRHVGSRGIAGEVVYYAPCGKKLKTYPDVTRYLDRNSITDLTRENFTFSSKYNIGDFMEARHGENGFTVLSEEEVLGRLMWAEKRKSRPGRSQRQDLKRQAAQDAARQAMEIKLRRKLEHQEMARRSAEFKILRKMEKQRQKDEEKRSKHMKVMERKKQKDQMKMMKQHEKVQRQEQIRLDREMRAQQILEDREMKRQQAVLLKEQEREWQKQMMLIANMERERRRQHMLLVKALEARKKQEERDKIKEEKKAEKCVIREKKIEQKRLELQLAHEMKEPREDLELGDLKPVPDLNRLPGVKLPGQALADCIMVLEFLNTFGEVLGFDETSMPNLDTLQKGLMNETEEDVEELMSIFTHLTQFAVDDPGVPNPKESHTRMGQKISDVEITDTVVSEVLRIFIRARAGKKHELCELLSDKPIEALNTTQKAAILAFLCNELLCSRVITSEIDNNIENMANLRRDKWVIEGKLRKLRIVQSKKFSRPEVKRVEQIDSNSAMSNSIGGETDMETSMSQTLLGTPSKHGSDEEEESGHESEVTDPTTATGNISEDDDPGTVEECEKKIEKLTKQHSQYRNKVFNASHKLRGSCFGQDRYKRWYWVLPYLGGVFVEGMESGEPSEQPGSNSNQALCDPDQRTVHIKQQLEKCKQDIIKLEIGDIEEMKVIKSEPMEVNEQNCTSLYNQSGENNPVKSEENGIDEKCQSTSNSTPKAETLCNGDLSSNHLPLCKEEGQNSDKLLIQPSHNNLCDDGDKTNSLTTKCPSEVSSDEPLTRTSTPHVPTSPLTNGTSTRDISTPESKPSFLSIDSMLKKDNNAPSLHSNDFISNTLLPNGPFSAEQMLKNLSDRQTLKPWFSILPRLSCDNSSGDHSNSSDLTNHPQLNSPLSFLSPVHFPAFQLHNPAFPSFQMGQIGVSPSDYNLLPLTPKTSSTMDDSFKVPNTPSECPATSNSPAPSDLHKYEPVEPIPIPDDCQLGWWRVSEQDKFKELVRALHPRGIRERDLQKAFQKNFDFVCHSCTKGNKEALEIDETKPEEEEEEETEAKEGEEEIKAEVKAESEDNMKIETEEIEGSEEKPDVNSSMLTAPTPDDPNVWNSSIAFDIESAILEEVEAMESRIFTASLQVKGWKLPQKVAELDDVEPVSRANTVLKKHQVYPLTVAKDKLLHLEKNIERRYLKPPFSKSVQIKVENMTAKIAEAQVNERRRLEEEKREDHEESEEEEHKEEQKDISKEKLPAGLVSWRGAVATASSPAQLALCLHLLNRSIAWEKSIMKVLCQLCRKDDNEAELLLCDSCDKGYHTYCFKPKMVCIPDGDWYCYECISKATGLPHCAVCGKKTGKLLECGTCPRALHMDCMETPLTKTPKKWFCAACVAEKSKNKKGKKKVVKKEEKTPNKDNKKDRRESESTSECTTPESKSKKSKNTAIVDSTKDSEDLEPCRVLLPELEKHADSWPFLQAVNTKQFPQYKKYIKHPMDFSTMRNKLRDNGYKCRGEFASDARLVFDNCETFNEDDSEVGKAGHNMRRLFEQRWKELCTTS